MSPQHFIADSFPIAAYSVIFISILLMIFCGYQYNLIVDYWWKRLSYLTWYSNLWPMVNAMSGFLFILLHCSVFYSVKLTNVWNRSCWLRISGWWRNRSPCVWISINHYMCGYDSSKKKKRPSSNSVIPSRQSKRGNVTVFLAVW